MSGENGGGLEGRHWERGEEIRKGSLRVENKKRERMKARDTDRQIRKGAENRQRVGKGKGEERESGEEVGVKGRGETLLKEKGKRLESEDREERMESGE